MATIKFPHALGDCREVGHDYIAAPMHTCVTLGGAKRISRENPESYVLWRNLTNYEWCWVRRGKVVDNVPEWVQPKLDAIIAGEEARSPGRSNKVTPI